MGNTNENKDEFDQTSTDLYIDYERHLQSPLLNGSHLMDIVVSSDLSSMSQTRIMSCYLVTGVNAGVVFRTSGQDYYCHLTGGAGLLCVEIRKSRKYDPHPASILVSCREVHDLIEFLDFQRTQFAYDMRLNNSYHFAISIARFLNYCPHTSKHHRISDIDVNFT